MTITANNARYPRAAGLAALLLLGACAQAPETGVAVNDAESLVPALIPPADVADLAERPSYEVGIATAAADRNGAKVKCVDLAKVERETCEAAADAQFATAEAGLDDLRGNQQ